LAGQFLPGLGNLIIRIFPEGAVSTSLFWTWLAAIGFSQAVFNRRLRPFWRFVLGVLVLAIIFISLFQKRDWTSGWAPVLAAIVIILWVGMPRWGLVVTLVGAALAMTKLQSITGFVAVGDTDYSIMTRVEAWRLLFQIIKVSPILGWAGQLLLVYAPFSNFGVCSQVQLSQQLCGPFSSDRATGPDLLLWFAWEVGWLAWRLRK